MSENPEWMETAPCRGMDQDIFYPQRGEDVSIAKAVCAQCPHRQPCLDYANAHGEHHGAQARRQTIGIPHRRRS